ncbi:DUF72 domain-containing protein [Arhodomonas aquaeolei]|uniref:DUF72 domain-containing protein n=1 Tax=Arhodomonas aquaeolei TaxID=2369 RepID=UPI002168A770|nr:DUF72 domain-containing protein [Arhodomonas aquaeolei]MCS4504016.1 DUF72 domain-containing protein [Arhodomonas aquaeolei]
MSTADVHIATSGYDYDHWRERFYPPGLARTRRLAYYAERFPAVEINGTFYSLPKPETVAGWREQVPEGFRFVLKFSRYGSHIKRLREPQASLPRFAEMAEALGGTLGGVLLQLPPRWRPVPERLDAFLAAAPAWPWAVEFRDERWLTDEVLGVLRRRDAALCVHDALAGHPRVATAARVYLRLHGGAREGGGYTDAELDDWASWLAAERDAGRAVWAFFNNDQDGHAVVDAARLQARLGG